MKRTVFFIAALALLRLAVPTALGAEDTIHSRYFNASDGVRLHYLEAGSGPVIVFVPGYLMPAEIWKAQLVHFAADHRVVALDPRSQGRSEKPPEGHYLARRGRDVGELIEHLDQSPATVVGWSLGALEVLTHAQSAEPDSLRAVILVDMILGVDQGPGEPHPYRPVWQAWITGLQLDREQWTRQWVRRFFRSEPSDAYLDDLVRAALQTPTNSAVTLLANLLLFEERDMRPALAALECPVLFVVDANTADHGEGVQRQKPDLRLEVFEKAGHALFVDEPEQFNEVLEDFLATVKKNDRQL